MKLIFVNTENALYKDAIAIRTKLFFDKMPNSLALINDSFEAKGKHLVCLIGNEVIGTGRINFDNETSIISQMAVKSAYQKQGVGGKILNELVRYSKEKNLSKIKLSARETALAFYEKFGFVAIGDKYPSKKTGVTHQQMALKID